MGNLIGSVCIGMEVITGEIRTITTKIDLFLLRAFVDIAGFGLIQKLHGAIFASTAFASCLFYRDIQILCNSGF